MSTDLSDPKQALYNTVAQGARDAGVFGEVTINETGVSCAAANSAEPAFYTLSVQSDGVWISLETEDRWLSGSIEGDLVNTGDKLDELIEEEVIDLGHLDAQVEAVEHYRSPEMMYVFKAKLADGTDHPELAKNALIWLTGFEIVFRELGDMDESEED